MDEAVDSNDRGDRNNGRTEGNRERRSSSGYRGGVWDRRQVNGGSSHNTGRGSAGDGRDGGGGDDHWKDERDWRALSAFSTPSDTESEESEERTRGTPRSDHAQLDRWMSLLLEMITFPLHKAFLRHCVLNGRSESRCAMKRTSVGGCAPYSDNNINKLQFRCHPMKSHVTTPR
ncbi:hypothetical protein B0F90DRAFT_1257918 [Multifurca ochricompacta]|uniref:Uncharacterized protein n=1 Tax=Multifurca ochricompacta TaxID=376703 RepID=A0AAD4M715_9AGAM|nr:hypothetical protein B0F90DRAFT_1257918 [Multifurca ochricompacta]